MKRLLLHEKVIDWYFFCFTKQKLCYHFIDTKLHLLERNHVFATNSNFLSPISLQPDGVSL